MYRVRQRSEEWKVQIGTGPQSPAEVGDAGSSEEKTASLTPQSHHDVRPLLTTRRPPKDPTVTVHSAARKDRPLAR